MRKQLEFTIEEPALLKSRLLRWARGSEKYCLLDSNTGRSSADPYSRFDLALAIEPVEELAVGTDALSGLQEFCERHKDWVFGFLSYDLKNQVEKLQSGNKDRVAFPLLHFFRPRYVFLLKGNVLSIQYLGDLDTAEDVLRLYKSIEEGEFIPGSGNAVSVKSAFGRDQYLRVAERLKQHIQLGDIYEVNFCQEFFAEDAVIDPVETYERLNALSGAPFSCFYRLQDKYLFCASPERFLCKRQDKLLSQPIKGTAKRSSDHQEDELLKARLEANEKERSENIMIVDLVRNDLSRVAERGSVKVDELCGVYSFEQVHQLISTISCTVAPATGIAEIIRSTFPMGSMTGAPKVRAMQLIEEYEQTRRGLYSGSVGYIDPQGNFDFNVVIRSILYNQTGRYASFITGSAITAQSDVQQEYEECLLKANAMRQVLANS